MTLDVSFEGVSNREYDNFFFLGHHDFLHHKCKWYCEPVKDVYSLSDVVNKNENDHEVLFRFWM